jgi:hypothetical protein
MAAMYLAATLSHHLASTPTSQEFYQVSYSKLQICFFFHLQLGNPFIHVFFSDCTDGVTVKACSSFVGV